jgi:hypothetical protein
MQRYASTGSATRRNKAKGDEEKGAMLERADCQRGRLRQDCADAMQSVLPGLGRNGRSRRVIAWRHGGSS